MTVLSLAVAPNEQAAIWLSVKVALWCVALSALPGVGCGWLLARKRFPGKAVVDAIIHLPLVLPPVVTGYLLLLLLGRRGMLGGVLHDWLGLDVAFTWWAAVLASAVVGFPLLVRAVRLGIELVDRRLEQAGATLGASPWRVLLTVTLPLALPGILTGLLLSFARSLGEFGATITFAGNIPGRTQTLPLAVYTYTQTPGNDGPALHLIMLSILISFAALLVSEFTSRHMGRKLGHGR